MRTFIRARLLPAGWIWLVAVALAVAPTLEAGTSQERMNDDDVRLTSASSWSFKGSERCLMRKVNRKRARRGLRRLSWDKQLGYAARRHARAMSRAGSIWHDGRLGRKITNWQSLGDTVGMGGACKRIFRAFWNSSGHRTIMLGRWRYVGAGTRWRNGRMYTHMVFEHYRNPGNVWGSP